MFTYVLSAVSFQCPPGQQGALDLTDGFLQPGQAMGDITHTHTSQLPLPGSPKSQQRTSLPFHTNAWRLVAAPKVSTSSSENYQNYCP